VRIFSKGIVFMVLRKLTYLVVITVVACGVCVFAQEQGPANEASVENQIDKQLKLNKQALLGGSFDAAVLILEEGDFAARKILLDILNNKSNTVACQAICKALIQARIDQKPIKNKDDFIEPLLNLLAESDAEDLNLIADASLLFSYNQVSRYIEKMVSDTTSDAKARVNIITALKRRPDKKAILKLMELLEDKDAQVASAAEKALKSIGIPVGKDAKSRQRNMRELSRKGKDEFLSDWLTRQQETMQELAKENVYWKKRALEAFDKVYDLIADDVERGSYLELNLKSPEVELRLWALEKVALWRKGTNPNLPAELGSILIGLICDPDRDVRLKTANLLSIMNELNSAEKLLAQVRVEKDPQVKMELFIALGGACYYAFLPNSPTKISPEIKIETLDLAAQYLQDADPAKAQRGAAVIKKLLEQDGLPKAKVNSYLNMLTERFKLTDNDQLKSELMAAMGGICAQSIYKRQAIVLYRPLFEESLHSETDIVREAAVDGLTYIDRAEALKILRKDYINDSSTRVVQSIIKLANEVGSVDDLDWLAEKITAKTHSDISWQAMLKIFKGCETDVLDKWVDIICVAEGLNLADEQKLSFLDIAEAKAEAEKKTAVLAKVRPLLADIYEKSGNFAQAANYIELLRETAAVDQKQTLTERVLALYLKGNDVKAVSDIISKMLAKQDLPPESNIIIMLEVSFKNASYIDTNNALLDALKKIRLPKDIARPLWKHQLEEWSKPSENAKAVEK